MGGWDVPGCARGITIAGVYTRKEGQSDCSCGEEIALDFRVLGESDVVRHEPDLAEVQRPARLVAARKQVVPLGSLLAFRELHARRLEFAEADGGTEAR